MNRALTAVSAVLLLAACGPTDDGVRLYRDLPKAPSYSAEDIEALKYMGPTVKDRGVNFAVYSENATRLELLLFEDPESNLPTRTYPMTRFGAVWNVFVEGVGPGQHYGYRAWGLNWEHHPDWIPGSIAGFKADVDEHGNRFNPNKLLSDPYSKALHRDHDWGKGNLASGPKRTEVTYAAAGKSVVTQSSYVWSENETTKYWPNRQNPDTPGHRWNDLIVYEVHLKGFTANSASAVSHPGTYRGFGEKADYFKELGITAVELLPIHEKPLDGTYWGYNTLNFFAPELSYASRKRWNEVIDEFKWMVDELHKRDIEVIVDVVYNHTGEGGFWRNKIEPSPKPGFDQQLLNLDPKEIAGLYSYRGLDNQAYYALDPTKQNYWNDTGVGNQTRANHRPFRKLTMDSLRFYVEELHVDGFRFDLAPILGTSDVHDGQKYPWSPDNSLLEDIINDPTLQSYNTRIIAEPWSAAGFFLGGFPASDTLPGVGWGEWNAHFRDFWRSLINQRLWNQDKSVNVSGEYWNGSGWSKEVPSLGEAMTGSGEKFSWNKRRPYHSVNFITVHDGFTLYDLFTYPEKRNHCSPLNPICCSDPFSSFCDPNSGEDNNRSRDWQDEAKKRQMMRNAFVAMLISHGTPMIYGGDEWMRTQLGNNNAYSTSADNEWNWFDWGAWQANNERRRMHDFVKKMIQFRKEHAYAFAPTEYGKGAPFAWKSPANAEADWAAKAIMVHYHDKAKGAELAILINMDDADVPFTLPQGRAWKRMVDTQAWFDSGYLDQNKQLDKRTSHNIVVRDGEPISTATYGVPAKSIVILEAR